MSSGQPILVTAAEAPNVRAQLELEPDASPRWLTGHFSLIVRDQLVGNWDDWVSLAMVRDWLRDFTAFEQRRWGDSVAGLDPVSAYRLLVARGYGDESSIEESSEAIRKYDITVIGATAFDRLTMLLLDPTPTQQWLIWGSGGTAADPAVVEWIALQHGELFHLATAIVAKIDRLG